MGPSKIFLAGLLSLAACTTATKQNQIIIDPAALDASHEAFLPHDNYVQLTTPYAPIAPVLLEVEARTQKLISRGESHVTLITPPEFGVLKSTLTIEQLNAFGPEIQRARFEVICVGSGSATIEKRGLERTYYLVLNSPDLVEIRRKIEKLYRDRGGTGAFEAEHFYAHITLGYTHQDLHEHQGVLKDRASCLYPVVVR